MRAARAALAAGVRLAAADAVARHVGDRSELRTPGYVGGYWAVNGEVPLHAVQLRLAPGQVWCLPLIQPDGTLRYAPWRSGDATSANRFGIPEPAVEPASTLAATELVLALVPLLGFDSTGHRLGMGGGFYDRTFAFRQTTGAPPALVGVGYAFQEIAALAHEPWDVRLDAVVTEHGWRPIGR